MRAGLSWVPVGRLMCSSSSRRESSEPKISSSPAGLPGAPPVGIASSSCIRRLPSTERRVFLGIWMGNGWITSPGGPWVKGQMERARDEVNVRVKRRNTRTARETVLTHNSPDVLEGLGHPSLPWVQLGPAKGVHEVMEGSRGQAGNQGHRSSNQSPHWE